jgi:hypothetical protein
VRIERWRDDADNDGPFRYFTGPTWHVQRSGQPDVSVVVAGFQYQNAPSTSLAVSRSAWICRRRDS